MGVETALTRWRDRWTAATFPAIPLRPQGKRPVCQGWNERPPAEQWAEAGGVAFRGNIGVILGNGNAVIDCDAPSTTERVKAGLVAMGATLPTVPTPSGGRHFYLRVGTCPPGQSYTLLGPDIGPGELRYGPGCYVVAPCSWVNGTLYRFTEGGPEAISKLRVIDWRDLSWLLTPTVAQPDLCLEAPPLRLLRRDLPAKAERLLLAAGIASPGLPLLGYRSRSEAEAAACALMILAGWTLGEIENEFRQRQPGHYQEAAKPDRYLARTYRAVLNTLAAEPTRQELASTYAKAQAQPWPGRSGLLDKHVYCGLLAIGWEHATWTPHASIRDLAQYAAASQHGVRNALRRLQARGLVTRTSNWQACPNGLVHAQGWKIGAQMSQFLEAVGESNAGQAPVAECLGVAEVWAPAGLGRSAGAVWRWLGDGPASVTGLADATGKSRPTVRRALARLAAFDLAVEVAEGWVLGDAELADVAQELGAPEAAKRRRVAHELQRRAWREWSERRRDQGTTNTLREARN